LIDISSEENIDHGIEDDIEKNLPLADEEPSVTEEKENDEED